MALSPERKVEAAEDWQVVLDALRRISADGGDKRIHQIAEPDVAFENLVEGTAEVWFVGGFLVAYGVSTPWYSSRQILHELLVVRVGPGGTLHGVAQFLRRKAREAGAYTVAVGTAFAKSDRALSRLYQAEGFKPEAVLLTREP